MDCRSLFSNVRSMLKSDMVGAAPQAELCRATQDLGEVLQDDIFEQLGCRPAIGAVPLRL